MTVATKTTKTTTPSPETPLDRRDEYVRLMQEIASGESDQATIDRVRQLASMIGRPVETDLRICGRIGLDRTEAAKIRGGRTDAQLQADAETARQRVRDAGAKYRELDTRWQGMPLTLRWTDSGKETEVALAQADRELSDAREAEQQATRRVNAVEVYRRRESQLITANPWLFPAASANLERLEAEIETTRIRLNKLEADLAAARGAE